MFPVQGINDNSILQKQSRILKFGIDFAQNYIDKGG